VHYALGSRAGETDAKGLAVVSDIPKIGRKNPSAVIRDVGEELPKLRTLVCVGIYEDDSADVWASDNPSEIERAAIILMSVAQRTWECLR
jgi:hypothetical protein